MSSGPVLIAGGYGLVGGQVAELLRERHPELPLALGGRRPEVAGPLARRLGASAVGLDVTPRTVKPLSDVRRVAFGGGPRVRVYRPLRAHGVEITVRP